MKILFDHQVFTCQSYGGVSRIFNELIQHLTPKKEAELSIFAGLHISNFPLDELKKQVSYYRGKHFFRFPYDRIILKKVNNVLFKYIMKASDTPSRKKDNRVPDIYHPSGYSPVVYNWKKSPLVLTINDMIPELFPGNFKDIKTRLENKRKCIERADHIIAISNTTKSDLMKFYPIDEKKISVIYPGALTQHVERYDCKPYEHEKPYILYVGTRKQGYKNFEGLLAAYAGTKHIKDDYDVICFGGPDFSRDERDVMSMLNVLDNVYYAEGNDLQLARLYAGASLFIYPSLYEGFGLPPLEAMALGCPVVSGRVSVMPEVLGDAVAWCEPHSPESIATAMEEVLIDEQRRQELIAKGIEQVQKYSWSQMAEETYAVYRQITGIE